MDKILTLPEAAEILRVTPGTLKTYCAQRKIEHLRGGKFTESQLQRYLASITVKKFVRERVVV